MDKCHPLLACCLIAVIGVLPAQSLANDKSGTNCEKNGILVDKNFATGRFNSCQWLSDNHVQLNLVPEDKPINDSPWYGFKLSAKQKQAVKVTLNYQHSKHRYWPKVSIDKKHWVGLKKQRIKLTKDKKQLTMSLMAAQNPLWISAQPVIDNQDYQDWLQQFSTIDGATIDVIGKTIEQRSLYQLTSATGDNAPVLVFFRRQHPPEVTGAIAMQAFIEELFSASELAVQFRQRFNLLVYPNLNPDGVANGNWRHNSGSKDLNRDWGPFSQPETRQVMNAIEQQIVGKAVWGMLDFHSTWDDILYIQKPHDPIRFPKFTQAWLDDVNSQSDLVIDFTPKPGHNHQSPTSKTYFYERFNVPAITYEIADRSRTQDIRAVSVYAAQSYMKLMLQRLRS